MITFNIIFKIFILNFFAVVMLCNVQQFFFPSVHNVHNGQYRTPNICNNIPCIDMIAALENSSIMFTSTCKVLIQTECNGILRKCLLQCHLEYVSEISLCTLRRSFGPKIVTTPRRHLNTISHTSAHVDDYAHIT